MGKTIIQTIGPLYGEAVNGTVFGRPNGSVFVPISNTIEITANTATQIKYLSDWFRAVLVSNIFAVAESQDLANYIERQVFSDSECTTLIASTSSAAGQFNSRWDYFAKLLDDVTPPENGDKVYVRCQLMASSGVAVATSNVIELEVVI